MNININKTLHLNFYLQISVSYPVALRIVCDGKVILQSVIGVQVEETFADIIQQAIDLRDRCFQIESVFVGSNSFGAEDLFKIEAYSTIGNSMMAIGSCTKILCNLQSGIVKRPSVSNAFDTLMSTASASKLPAERSEKDGRSAIYNRLIAYLKQNRVGFRTFQETEMEFSMTSVVTMLWQLDGHRSKFTIASNVSKLPEDLYFVPPHQNTYRILVYGTHKKKTIPQLKLDELVINHDRLEYLTTRRFIQAESWKVVLKDVTQLKKIRRRLHKTSYQSM